MSFAWSDIQILSLYANAIYGSSLYPNTVDSDRSWNIQHIRSGNAKHCQFLRRSSLKQRIQRIGGFLLLKQDENDVYLSPWYVVYDPFLDAVVICIRGTKSVKDTVTSMRRRLIPIRYKNNLDPSGFSTAFAHQGMYTSARNIQETLRNTRILDSLFHMVSSMIPLPQYILDSISHSTRLLITGHSLGGGIALILSYLLQQSYPNYCISFAPPGQTILKERDQIDDRVACIIIGNDIVPRISSLSVVLYFYTSHLYHQFVHVHYRRRRARSVVVNEPLVQLPGHILHLLRIPPSITRVHQQVEYRIVKASAEEFWTLSLHNHWFTDHFIFNYPRWFSETVDDD